MKQLLAMVESARIHKVRLSDTLQDFQPDSPEDGATLATEAFFDLVEQCQPFVLISANKTPVELEGEDYSFDPTEPITNAPFKVYSIEMLGDHLSISAPRQGDAIQVYCNCLLAYETSPMRFITYAFTNYFDPVRGKRVEAVMLTAAFNDILKELTQRINVEETGFRQINAKIKLGTGSGKRFHKIKRIVYVKPKKVHLSSEEESEARQVNWTQRWFVRGHWRKTDALGKDREGNYCVEGHTWVSEHIKGPEEAPLVKKTRIVSIQP